MRTICRYAVALTILALAASTPAAARTEPKLAASGKTQIVARAAGREITLSELRAEMARLRLSPNEPGAERVALENVVNRAVLAEAARKADIHRRPEALARVRAAEDEALAGLYLAVAAQPAEPTRAEIDDYVRANPSLFADRRVYDFSVLTMPTAAFDELSLTPLFDAERDFSALAAHLEAAGVDYAVAGATQASTAFPKPVREQLARYGAADNIVITGAAQTQIMKIVRARREATPTEEWTALARRLLLEEEAAARVEALMARLKREAAIAYYRASAAPAEPPLRSK